MAISDELARQLVSRIDALERRLDHSNSFETGGSSGGGASSPHDPVTLDADADAFLSISASQVLGTDVQTANTVFAGPASGAASNPGFRASVEADFLTHDIAGSKHTITGSINDIVGACAANTLGLLTPTSDGETNVSTILQSSASGRLRLARLGIGTASITDTLTVVGDVDFIHTAIEADDHTLELDVDAAGFGDVKAVDVNYDTGAIATGQDEAVILANINEIDATGGEVFGLEVLATDGGADAIYGIKVGAVVGAILQDSGTFANPSLATNDTVSTDVPDMRDGSTGTNTTIFVLDDDYIIIGAAAAFTEMEFVIETPASNPGIKPTFEYSISGTNQFTAFTPIDGTNGFRNTGVVAWDAADLTGHVADDVTGAFQIRITRTHAVAGSVSLFYAKTAATVVFSWDKSGDVSINALDVNGGLTISNGTQNYLLTGNNNEIAWQGQTPGVSGIISLYSSDGDGTHNVILSLFGVGSPESIVDRERLVVRFAASASAMQIFSEADGTGTLRPLILFTEGNTDQLYFDTNGNIGIGTASPGAKLDINGSVITASNVFINETVNTKMGIGLTINQGALDAEILALKSSDVAHGITGQAETDTFGLMKKAQPTSGGLKIEGLKDADGSNALALQLIGTLGEAVQTAKTTSATGIVTIDSQIKSGTGTAVAAANGNLVVMRNQITARWILDAEGDIFYGGSDDGAITDEYDDAQLLSGFRAMMSPKDSPAFKRFKGWLGDAEEVLVQQGVLAARLAEGGLVSDTALKGLLIDAIMQLADKVESLERKLNHGAE